MKISILVAALLFWGNAYACSIPAQGAYWTHDKLIEKTDTIYLVTPVSDDHRFRFKVIEVLKGENAAEFQWRRFRSRVDHKSTDFESHNDPDFWKAGDEIVARSPYYPGACTLKFTFVQGENYLIFKESPGHFHSAEIIKTVSDKWYQYVRASITHYK
ncbi:hypothetical protein MO867_21680 [Microbulbifer sp. OS29]|uniref:Uncharacterized protein n=1 Tax=Microbulbifer okhotskensis TaxID=2926617 RepID=A0A9X2J6R9_9GAMM|nr:hypothetical protein [Microbulbifer okhotskensis]MCO1336942.1 hypothetical protein [Microbulbifer okhotskensis]